VQLQREFWVGVFTAAVGASVGFGAAATLGLYNLPLPVAEIAAWSGLIGFVLGATSIQIHDGGLRPWASQYFGVDLRSLGVIRIGLAITILVDLAMRARDLEAHYCDAGVLPRSASFYRPSKLSLHLLSGEPWFQAILFVVAAVFAILMLVGWRARMATFVTWLLLISLQNRNPCVQTGGDALLRMLVFWCMFLPVNGRYALDSALNLSLSKRRKRIADVATLGILVQLAAMYGFSALLKTGDQWRENGSATYYALSLDMLTTPLGQWLREFPALLRGATFFVYYLELFALLIIFMPWRNAAFRLVMFLLLFSMHLSFQLCMYIGVFPLVAMVGVIALVPSGAWDWCTRKFSPPRGVRPVVYYDSACGFCRGAVLFWRAVLMIPSVRIRRDTVDPTIAELMDPEQTWVVVDAKGQQHIRFDGLLELMRGNCVLRPLAGILALRPLAAAGNWLYRVIAVHRGAVGRLAFCLRARHWRVRAYWPIQPLLLIFLVYVLVYNCISLGWDMSWLTSRKTYTILGRKQQIDLTHIYDAGRQLRLDQNWKLFAPYPMVGDGWFVARGRTVSGETVDVCTGDPATFEKPRSVANTYPNNRWRKYMEKLRTPGGNVARQRAYCEFLCRQWNAVHEGQAQLESVDLFFVLERSQPPHIRLTRTPKLVASCRCSHDRHKADGAMP
jgi:hypothetical protein